MRPVKIISDSTCDLSPEQIKDLDIEIMPLYINIKDKSFKDNVDITVPDLYRYVEEDKVLPKTSAIGIQDYIDTFKAWIDRGYDIVFTGISGGLSSSHNNSRLAIEELGAEDKVFSVDSKNLSTGIGLLLLKACEKRDMGASASMVAEYMKSFVERVKSQFVIDRFDYLYKGGRCSSMARIFGTMLKIKPLITVRDGKMTVAEKPHGKKIKGLDALLRFLERDKDKLDLDHVFVTHTYADEDAKYLVEKIKAGYNFKNIYVTNAGSTIASHCGPGTIGILYIVNE
ncbi:MAG: DegV family protein [Acholeplasmatales bacterium]|nr:DegV family protein [Acholeplasmatales bacterium]